MRVGISLSLKLSRRDFTPSTGATISTGVAEEGVGDLRGLLVVKVLGVRPIEPAIRAPLSVMLLAHFFIQALRPWGFVWGPCLQEMMILLANRDLKEVGLLHLKEWAMGLESEVCWG